MEWYGGAQFQVLHIERQSQWSFSYRAFTLAFTSTSVHECVCMLWLVLLAAFLLVSRLLVSGRRVRVAEGCSQTLNPKPLTLKPVRPGPRPSKTQSKTLNPKPQNTLDLVAGQRDLGLDPNRQV